MQLLFTGFADLLVHRGISVFLSPDIDIKENNTNRGRVLYVSKEES